jgi:hypothetical protein
MHNTVSHRADYGQIADTAYLLVCKCLDNKINRVQMSGTIVIKGDLFFALDLVIDERSAHGHFFYNSHGKYILRVPVKKLILGG